ncbi:hypothetical protein HDU97_005391 [Phlyctochytrium planicorne]|nr:hypothetical protein HDU97_005391 [Phlyctochytrium planicorne]
MRQSGILSICLWAALIALWAPSASRADPLDSTNIPVVPGSDFNFSVFDQIENGFDATAGALSLLWTIENRGSQNEILHGVLMFNGTAAVTKGKQVAPLIPGTKNPTLLNAWFAIAFGRSMLTADFMVVWITPGGSLALVNLSPTGNYQTPIANPGPKILTDAPKGFPAHVSFNKNGIAFIEFRRFTIPRATDSSHVIIDIDASTDLIWAYNINPDSTPATSWATYHGLWRGSYFIKFLTGEAGPQPEVNVGAKKVHGVGMFIVWQFVFPLAIYWARYAKSIALINSQWMWVHIIMQASGTICAAALAIYICVNLPPQANFGPSTYLNLTQRPHPIIGFTLLAGLGLQVILGALNRLGLQFDGLAKYRGLYRGIHDWFGRCLLILSISQVALGINTLYPWPDALPSYTGRGYALWIAYFLLTGSWLVAFLVTEIYWMSKVNQRDRGLGNSKTGRGNNVDARGVEPGKALAMAAIRMNPPEKAPLMEMANVNNGQAIPGRFLPALRAFTWEEIDSELQNGQMYVVANGRYVYDIQKWIWSHPGGQIILHSVAGTDITNDYFHEAGFDAEAFVPTTAAEKKARNLPTTGRPSTASRGAHGPNGAHPNAAGFAPRAPPPEYAQNVNTPARSTSNFPSLSEQEWRHVVKARRPHVHSRLAIEKLSTLLVGELVGREDGRSLFVEQAGAAMFSEMEYRRFAIVESCLASGNGAARGVYRIKFCILYPHDTRVNEPKVFLPGQCVEVQLRVNNKYVSRYLTPISGSPSCFEVLVRLEPKGGLTPALIRQKPGDRQIRVRGPFGSAAVHPDRPFDFQTGEWAHRRMLFITAGSGVAPALQMAQFLFLPTYVPVYAYQSYVAENGDELSVYEGDWVIARTHLLDGWAEGVNLRTNEEGIFPLPITFPRCGGGPIVGVMQSVHTPQDAFGVAVLQGASLAYPDQIRVHTSLTRGGGGKGGASHQDYGSEGGLVGSMAAMVPPEQWPQGRVPPGVVTQGRVTVEDMRNMLMSVGWPSVNGQFGGGYGMDQEMSLSRIVVCGPKGFEGFVYESLVDILGVPHQNITMLPDDHYL